MAEDIPYNKAFELIAGRAAEVAPGVRALVANNPGPFTFKGTVSYIIGRGDVANSIPDRTMRPTLPRYSTPCAVRT